MDYSGALMFAASPVVLWFANSSKWLNKVHSPVLVGSAVPKFLSLEAAQEVDRICGSPAYVYSETALRAQAEGALSFPAPFGLTVRFAMKACPNVNILKLFSSMGLCFDASSGFEVSRAIAAGISPSCISLSAQELPENILELLSLGIHFNACSMHQLVSYGELRKHFPEKVRDSCGVRFNPGVGSGGTGKTNVGGPAASFGIWHAYKDEVAQVALTYGLRIVRIHTHIGSGSDPLVWERATHLSLRLVHHFPHVTTLNLGGGFKVARMPYEKSTDLQVVGAYVNQCLSQFAMETKRQLHLEIEPGTYLVANAGVLLCRVQDIVDTLSGSEGAGYRFLKVNSGMTEVLRPSLYGAQHPIALVAAEQKTAPREEHSSYVVVGHCCESGDLFSCEPGEPEALRTVSFPRPVRIGDYLSIEGAGAYCSSMSTKNYNSFPEAPETLLCMDGSIALLRQRQTLKQILQNEIAIIL